MKKKSCPNRQENILTWNQLKILKLHIRLSKPNVDDKFIFFIKVI
jgi:hypothetical protein